MDLILSCQNLQILLFLNIKTIDNEKIFKMKIQIIGIVTCYNVEKYVKETLLSLITKFQPDEVMIINDGVLTSH